MPTPVNPVSEAKSLATDLSAAAAKLSNAMTRPAAAPYREQIEQMRGQILQLAISVQELAAANPLVSEPSPPMFLEPGPGATQGPINPAAVAQLLGGAPPGV